jgi:4-cresol dehydrogenase (hydroxylating)
VHRRSPIQIPPASGESNSTAGHRGGFHDFGESRAFLAAITGALGTDGVNRSEETIRRYGENTMPGGDRPPAGVVYPASTADVQLIVRAANTHKVGLYPISTGNNIGLGSRSASASGQVVVDLGRKMNCILDIDEKLAFAVVEPGVSYQALYDELVRRGNN